MYIINVNFYQVYLTLVYVYLLSGCQIQQLSNKSLQNQMPSAKIVMTVEYT